MANPQSLNSSCSGYETPKYLEILNGVNIYTIDNFEYEDYLDPIERFNHRMQITNPINY